MRRNAIHGSVGVDTDQLELPGRVRVSKSISPGQVRILRRLHTSWVETTHIPFHLDEGPFSGNRPRVFRKSLLILKSVIIGSGGGSSCRRYTWRSTKCHFSLCRTAEGESSMGEKGPSHLWAGENISDLLLHARSLVSSSSLSPLFERLHSDGVTAPSLVPSPRPETFSAARSVSRPIDTIMEELIIIMVDHEARGCHDHGPSRKHGSRVDISTGDDGHG